ncbi:hypothetical protein BKA70DRAFT_1247732 [Coprinopsis sp. MPI-PUGE-AT-0042]|nr:hypothetical protein BKA70DRAFT_1247732 [Coprinopsis sp. MPI-PUGE-AT-0042]
MQAPQPAGPSRRAVGLPSNPRQGRVLAEASQPALAPAPVQKLGTSESGRSTPSGQRRPRVAASPPASRVPLPKNPRNVKPSPVARIQAKPMKDSPSASSSGNAYNEPPPPNASSKSRTDVATTHPTEDDPVATEEEPTAASPDYQGLTAPIWNTVASVANIASNLTLNVRIPWSPDSTEDGEQTPVGTESRLTRALKSYHLSKAQTHRDLPDWLFTDKERRSQPAAVARTSQSSDEGQATTTYQLRVKTAEGSQGNREGGFNAARPAPAVRSLGSERLKALRERRRFEAGM